MSAKTRLNVSLPEQMLSKIHSFVEQGEYATPSEYLRDLARKDFEARRKAAERQAAVEYLREIASEAKASGEPAEIKNLGEWMEQRLQGLSDGSST